MGNKWDKLNEKLKDMSDKWDKLNKELDDALEEKLYSEIEYLIIMWSNDGTKTAGNLTRQIIEQLKKK